MRTSWPGQHNPRARPLPLHARVRAHAPCTPARSRAPWGGAGRGRERARRGRRPDSLVGSAPATGSLGGSPARPGPAPPEAALPGARRARRGRAPWTPRRAAARRRRRTAWTRAPRPEGLTTATCLPPAAQRTHNKLPKHSRARRRSEKKPRSAPSPSASAPGSQRDSPFPGPSRTALLPGFQQEYATQASSPRSPPWSFQRSKSLFCLPSGGPSPTSSAEPQWFPNAGPPGQRASGWKPGLLLSVDDLEGAQETDVDTGLRLSSSDLSVVSASSAPSRFCSTVETCLPSERCSTHWPAHKGPREGPLPAGSGVIPDTSWVSYSLITKESPSSETVATAPPASGASSLKESSPQLSFGAPKATQADQDMPPPSALAGPGDNDMEEFYI